MTRTDNDLKFDKAFDKFMDNVVMVHDEYWKQMGFTHQKPEFEVVEGRKYIKVVRNDHSQRSVHLFVDKTSGTILKAASWKSPAKHARGSIYSETNGLEALTPHGAKYL